VQVDFGLFSVRADSFLGKLATILGMSTNLDDAYDASAAATGRRLQPAPLRPRRTAWAGDRRGWGALAALSGVAAQATYRPQDPDRLGSLAEWAGVDRGARMERERSAR
jgi:hypothetical protein